MCLAIPARVVEIHEKTAKVDFGEGVMRDVDVTLVSPQQGDYILVHAGYAIQVIDKKAAEETIQLWEELFEHR
ncbi:MAG: HypC/HybG/HupF family hydrogenase formation chaperone [Candidatus Bathyarchaeota archaeon]|nr:MAG: HypC/HybG/HupF family hydrogenase formation chaperone [Candidatus Bathyarchaeota archaeon]